jgi:hypothetical protein
MEVVMSYTHHKAPMPPEIKKWVDAVGSRKRSASSAERKAGEPVSLRSYWDGGSREQFRAWDASGRELPIHQYVSGAPGFTPDPKPWLPQVGDVLVEYGTFMGKAATPHIIFYK